MTPEQRRWAALHERQLNGSTLTAEERDEFERLSTAEPARQYELEMYRQLSRLACPLDDNEAAIVARALAEVSARDKVVPLRRPEAHEVTRSPVPPERAVLSSERLDRSRAPRVGGAFAWASVGGGLVLTAAALLWWLEMPEPQAPPMALPQSTALPQTTALPQSTEMNREPPRAVELTFTSGQVFVDGLPTVVTASALEPNSTLSVGKSGRACIAIDTHTDVCLDADSSIVLDGQQGRQRSLRLVRGRVAAVLDKRPEEERFSIMSGSLSATALGTAFAVERTQSGRASVTVMEGRVEISIAEGAKRVVRANEQIEAQPQRVHGKQAQAGSYRLGEPVRTTRAEQLRHWSLVDPREMWKKPEVAILHVDSQPTQALVTLDGTLLGPAPLSLLVGTGPHALEFELEGHTGQKYEFKLTPGQEKRVRLPLVAEQELAPTAGTAADATRSRGGSPEEAASPAELLESARNLVRQGQWQGAVGAYQRLRRSYPKSPESHTVLVALGQLELDRLGQPANALSSFNRYLTRGGGLTQEARFGRIRALRALGDPESEARAIREYLGHYPGSADAASLKRRLARLDRQ